MLFECLHRRLFPVRDDQIVNLEMLVERAAQLFDMRLPLTFSLDDCALIADHILDAVEAVAAKVDA